MLRSVSLADWESLAEFYKILMAAMAKDMVLFGKSTISDRRKMFVSHVLTVDAS